MGKHKRIRLTLAGLLVCCWFLAGGLVSGEAFALIGDSEKSFGLDGSIRTLFFLLDQDGTIPFSGKNNIDALSQTIPRFIAAGKPLHSLSYEIHLVQSATFSTETLTADSPFLFGNESTSNVLRYRVLDASWNVLDRGRSQSTVFFDRFNAKISFDWGDVTSGRQAITFGKTYFWNPLDVFFPFDATQFDRDYKPGVDALRIDIPLGLFSGINVVGAAGPKVGISQEMQSGNNPQDASWYGSALLARLFTNASGWDFSFQGGKIYGGWHLGAGVVGDLGPVQIRAEAAQFLAVQSEPLPLPLKGDLYNDNFQGVFGLGHRFENRLSLDFEYFYNGAGDPNHLNAGLVRTEFGSSLQMSRHLMGLMVRYEFTPIVVGQLAAISSLSDGSTQLQPLLTVSLSNEMDLLFGAMLNFGPPPKGIGPELEIRSEFGTQPDIFFWEWKLYF